MFSKLHTKLGSIPKVRHPTETLLIEQTNRRNKNNTKGSL